MDKLASFNLHKQLFHYFLISVILEKIALSKLDFDGMKGTFAMFT